MTKFDLILAGLFLHLAACSQERGEAPAELNEQSAGLVEASGIGQRLAVYEFSANYEDIPRVSAQAQAALRLLSTRSRPSVSGVTEDSVARGLFALRLADDEGIVISYEATSGRLFLMNKTISHDRTNRLDVGEVAAHKVMLEAADALRETEILNQGTLEAAPIQARVVREAEGITGGPITGSVVVDERIREYVYLIPYTIDGIVVNDGGQLDLGVTIGIHRTGRVASVGVQQSDVASIANRSPVRWISRAVSHDDLAKRMARDHANATIRPLGLRYSVTPDSSEVQVLEPREAFWVSDNFVEDGKTIHGRASIVYYSVSDPNAVPTIWPSPNPGDTSRTPKPLE